MAKILICEDETLVAVELQRRLQELGYEVSGLASSSEEAFASVRQDRPDLALMDIHLRGRLSGIDVAKALGRDFDIPTIFLTGDTQSTTILEADQSSPLAYLIKPVNDDELALSMRYGLARHEAQRALKRELQETSAKAQAAEEALTEFRTSLASEARMRGLQDIIGGIAHHFNNSLLGFSLPLDLLITSNTLKPFEARHIRKLLEICASEKFFIQRLQWAAGQGGLLLAVHCINDLLIEVVQRFNGTIPADVEINLQFPPSPLHALVDKKALCHAVENLLRNAIEAVGRTGKIVLQLREIYAERPEIYNSRSSPGPFIEIAVIDSGNGITRDALKHVAEPFFTTHVSRVATGLGLTEAYGIAQSHGGWLSLSSTPQSGTTAELHIAFHEQSSDPEKKKYLPRAPEPITSPSEHAASLDPAAQNDVRLFGYL